MTWEGAGQVLLLEFYFLGEACPSVLLLVGKGAADIKESPFAWYIPSVAGLGGLPALYSLGKRVYVQGAGVVLPAQANWLFEGGLVGSVNA